jgi:hypothetical protein
MSASQISSRVESRSRLFVNELSYGTSEAVRQLYICSHTYVVLSRLFDLNPAVPLA